ncbi:Poly(A)-specific ribonuclease PARN-like, putative isoform 3 [Theobroma cacao]|uniref:Poly(A)-specific ribonuclease PARN-like, putative isoform 3 n=1 Tax=Theobroma cacao TaxID=3641 RepID=A0A061DUU0_THECC|nr:Poly(A)-specific ribonuclease PARN-like, putative isoform 3 [Theobroma cacao]
MVALIPRRLFCTKISRNCHQHQLQWSVKQVTKSNFNDSLHDFHSHLSSSDFVAVSFQNTGSFSAAWHRVSSFDCPETAYLKARRAADRFQLLQFAVCPFTISGSKVTAHPYNFHLFPRDELNIGMPSYSFSCQTSYLTAMAQQGFDFNACIYDGISYLSRAQELVAKVRMGNPIAIHHVVKPTSTPPSVADTIFVERVKSRVKHWKKACADSSSRKTDDFSVIHSKFIGPLPLNMDEFLCSLRLVFPHVFDVNHLMKEIGPLENVTNIPAAISYLKNRFFAPIDMEISHGALLNEGKIHGQTVLRICHLFAKLCSVLRITPGAIQSSDDNITSRLGGYAHSFKSCSVSSQESVDGRIRIWTKSPRKVGCKHLVFLWGFRDSLSAGMLKSLLQGSHDVFSEEFDVCLVDKSCAIVVFLQPNLSQAFLDIMSSEGISGSLRELVSEGLRAAGYETYKRACGLGYWEADLASALDKASATPDCFSQSGSETNPSEVYWCNDLMINLATCEV